MLRYIESKAPNLGPKVLDRVLAHGVGLSYRHASGSHAERALRRADVRLWLEDLAKAAPVMAN